MLTYIYAKTKDLLNYFEAIPLIRNYILIRTIFKGKLNFIYNMYIGYPKPSQ